MSTLHLLAVSLVFMAAATAQRTWVVDRQNRPGADFTDLPPAIAAAGAGDALFVRGIGAATPYSASVIGRSLTVVGEDASVRVESALAVRDLPPGQRVVIRRVASDGAIAVERCLGPVFLDGVQTTRPVGSSWRITDCALVSLHGCNVFAVELVIADSDVLLERCTLLAYYFEHGISLQRARLVFVESNCEGGPGIPQGNCQPGGRAGNGLDGTNSRVVVAGDSLLRGGSYVPCTQREWGLAMTGGAVLQDPRATIEGIDPTRAFAHTIGPVVTLEGQVANANLTTRLLAPVGSPSLTVLGQPAREPFDFPMGTLWLELGGLIVLDAGSIPANGERLRSLALPPGLPTATLFGLQSVVFTGMTAQLSTPSFVLTP